MATTKIHTLSLHDALPIWVERLARWFGADIIARRAGPEWMVTRGWQEVEWALARDEWTKSERRRRLSARSEEHTSELQSPCNIVCRLLLEKKKTIIQRV